MDYIENFIMKAQCTKNLSQKTLAAYRLDIKLSCDFLTIKLF